MPRRIQPIVLLCAGCTIVAGIIAVVAAFEAHRQNDASLQTQHAVVEFETGDAYLDMLGQLKHTAFNQSAYDNIVLHWNPDWIDGQFFSHLKYTGIPNVAVFGPDGRLRRLDSEPDASKLTEKNLEKATGLGELLAAVRGKGGSEPQKGTVVIDGRVYFAAAAAVTPQEITDAPVADELQYTVMFLKPAEDDHFALLSVGFQAEDVHIVTGPPDTDGLAAYPLPDASGKPIAYLQWKPQKPGFSFLMVLFPVLFVMLAALAVALAFGVRRWQKAQKTLLATEAKATAAQEESRIKSVFLGNVSHELRTPLNAIIGFAEMLDMKLFGPLGAKQYDEYAADILNSGKELLRIVNDLIEISNIESPEAVVACETIDAAPCLSEALAGARAQAAVKNVTLRLETDAVGAWCTASHLRLRQALSRLFEHAVRRSREGQSVTAFWRHEGDEIVIGVHDRGTHLAQEQTQNVGKLFLYTDSHMVSHEGGFGLGLAIAVGLTQAMGGKLSISCCQEDGCTTFLRLPAAEAASASCEAA